VIDLGLFALADVLNGAEHLDRLAVGIELQSATTVNPAFGLILMAHNPVFLVEKCAPAKDLVAEVFDHHLAVGGMDQVAPAFYRALIGCVDAEDLVLHRGAAPPAGGHIQHIAAKAGDKL